MICTTFSCLTGNWSRTLMTIAILGLVSSCANYPTIQPIDPMPAPAHSESVSRSPEGDVRPDEMSLWSEGTVMSDLFSDTKARRVGDIVTIQVSESSSAQNKASTGTERESSLSAGIQEFFGADASKLSDLNVRGGMESDFEGSGTTSRSGDLQAFITARVVEVLPGGNLKVIGSREILVNNEKQLMTIYGVVRPRDISQDNVVLSSFVSDARIAYSGAGIVDDRQRPGWMANTLNTIWPF
ncbi:MAG: flagellar basal body L-ring protein FlgH [Desulfobacterales bacterium]|nr:flagellar basal body L-ring protein FlgH [Desulfobacterales bacterium]MDJ0884650.1 flagellar basal body L-ring protein FlgH [Desulfobacterales bacterium]